MTRLSWLLFDLDGVLLPAGDLTAALRRDHGLRREQLAELFETRFDAYLVGAAELAEELPAWLERWSFPGDAQDFLASVFAAQAPPDPRLAARIAGLRGGGVRCGVASNQERSRAAFLEQAAGLAQAFDSLFFSWRIGARKPDPGFYAAVEAALGVPGREIGFWDDQAPNVEAARARGWHAQLYSSYERFEEQLAECGERLASHSS